MHPLRQTVNRLKIFTIALRSKLASVHSRHKSKSKKRTADSEIFAHRWRTLPEELRLLILIYVFAQEDPIDYDRYNKSLKSLHHALLLTGYAGIATEALCANNTFRVIVDSGRYPPPSQNYWIRRLEVDMELYIDFAGWSFLSKLCTGVFGFEKLTDLDIVFTWNIRSRNTLIPDISRWPSAPDALIIPRVEKLTATFQLLLNEPVHCIIEAASLEVQSVTQLPFLLNQISIKEGLCDDPTYPRGRWQVRMFDQEGNLHTWKDLPFDEMIHPETGRVYKSGITTGMLATRVQER